MKHYFAVSFLVVFLYIYNAEGVNCIKNSENNTCQISPSSDCPKITATKTIKQGKYILCDTSKWLHCADDECEPITLTGTDKTPCTGAVTGEVFVDNECIHCKDLIGHANATTDKKASEAIGMYDCYIPKDKTDSDEKGEFTYVAQCYVGCTDSNSYLCPSA